MKTWQRLLLLALAITLTVPGWSQAQVATGAPLFGSFGGGPFDIVNLGNLNVHFAIPVVEKAGRGMPFTYDLSYDSSIWYPVTCSSGQCWTPVSNFGWRGVTEAATGFVSSSTANGGTQGNCTLTIFTYSYHDTFGVSHNFWPTLTLRAGTGCGNPITFPQTLTATDGSGYSIKLSGWTAGTVTSLKGKVINAPFNSTSGTGTATDANGNQITINSSSQFFDTLSATAPVLTVAGTAPSPTTYTYTAPAGAQHYTMNYTKYNLATAFNCTGIKEFAGAAYLVSSIVLPDTTQYAFTYESTTGRLLTVTLPTGGKITYTYTDGSNNGIVCADGSTNGLTRTLNTGGTWLYDRSGTGNAWTTTVTTPPDPVNSGSASDITTINFEKDSATSGTTNYYETQRVVKQGASLALATIITCYNVSGPPTPANCPTAAVASPIKRVTQFTYLPNSSGQQAETDTDYVSGTNLPTDIYSYDFGAGAVGPLLRHTKTAYATLGNNILDHPSSIKVYDGASNLKAQTTYTYDEDLSTLAASGATQLQPVTGARGNLTTLAVQATSTTTLYRKFTHYDTGMLVTSTDVSTSSTTSGPTTTYNYVSSSASCNFAFPTSISEPLSLSRSMTWDCNGGVMLNLTDENGKAASADYVDPDFWRPDYTKDQLNNKTTVTYTGQTAAESNLSFNASASVSDILTTVDGFGRVILNQRAQGPGQPPAEYDSFETDYNIMGQPSKSTMPFQAAAGTTNSTAPGTTTVYDAMGRPTLVTDGGSGTVAYQYIKNDVLQTVGPTQNFSKQLEYDALGRVKSVCEITSVSGSGACGQSNAKNGFLTRYTYDPLGNLLTVTQNAQPGAIGGQQNRTYTFDEISRLTSETNPESGTTTYTYDSINTGNCSATSAGDLAMKLDAVGNGTCYVYDALHRVRSAGQNYTTPDTAATPDACFNYDAATVNGVSMSNSKLRLAEAYTVSHAAGCGAAKVTDEGFSYDADGRPTDLYESTPHSAGYYHSSTAYWANGALETLSLFNSAGGPLFPTQTYGLDGEGRPTTVTAASGQNPVTSVAYTLSGTAEPIGSLTNVIFGSLDSDSYQYDPSTGRMTKYTLSVNGQSAVGSLTWSANGTLSQLAITDPFNTQDNQTCANTYDDLARISGNTCTPSVWAQTFSYDPFGNISKSGSISWQPSYSTASNNQYQSGWNGASYDSDGNLLNDTFNTYTWDAYGNLASANGATIVYDAFGRMVENGNGGNEFAYAPGGTYLLGSMQGQVLLGAFIPLPGGAIALYNTGGLAQYNHADWLGSARLFSNASRVAIPAMSYAPFGEGYAGGQGYVQFTSNGNAFTVYDTENQSGSLTDFTYRRYSPVQGRWIAPDPAGLAAVDPTNPQTWNRYAYVANNPLSFIDPQGLQLKGPAQCDNNGPNSCPGGDIDSGALNPGGGGSLWSLSLSGMTMTTVYASYEYQWVSAGGADTTIMYGFDDDGSAILDGTIGSLQGGSWQVAGTTFTYSAGPILPSGASFASSSAANNGWQQGPDPVAVANSMRQYTINTLIINPARQLVKEGICGGSPSGALKEGRVGGAIKGGTLGAIEGYAGTGVLAGTTFGGPGGALLGGFIGGTVGSVAGVFSGGITAGICQATGVYGW